MELAGWFCLCCNASFTTLQFHIWFHSTSVANFPPPLPPSKSASTSGPLFIDLDPHTKFSIQFKVVPLGIICTHTHTRTYTHAHACGDTTHLF